MICIYHSRDLDGWMSAAIVKLKYPDVKLIGFDYGVDIPDLSFNEVIMVDISFSAEVMIENRNRLTWIDHHNSAILDSIKLNYYKIPGVRDTKFAACELTWKYFFPDESMPEIVRLLGRYDCFGHKGTKEEKYVLEFQYGARQSITNPEEALVSLNATKEWSGQGQGLLGNIHYEGQAIYKYLCTEAKQIYGRAFPIAVILNNEPGEITAYKFACVNQDRFNPINFGIDYHKDGYDGFACFWYQKGKWTFSLYNDNGEVDCSEIAKQYGGGGHKGASGMAFSTEDMLSFIQKEEMIDQTCTVCGKPFKGNVISPICPSCYA